MECVKYRESDDLFTHSTNRSPQTTESCLFEDLSSQLFIHDYSCFAVGSAPSECTTEGGSDTGEEEEEEDEGEEGDDAASLASSGEREGEEGHEDRSVFSVRSTRSQVAQLTRTFEI